MAVKSTILPELHEFISTLPADAAYADLPRLIREGGWLWRLRQVNAICAPGSVLLTFELQVGKDATALELLDWVSVQVPDSIPQVSLAGRNILGDTLIYMITGRLPPVARPPEPAPAPAPAKQTIELDDDDAEIEWKKVPEPDLPDIVGGRTGDGVPLFDDLYAIEEPPERVLKALFQQIDAYMPQADSLDKLKAFWTKNEREFAFVQDFGTAADKARLPKTFADRRNVLMEAGSYDAQAPRRRPARH